MANHLSTDQFVALETWVEACVKAHAVHNSAGPHVAPIMRERHRARQRAFTLLTGIEAPLIDAKHESEDSDLA